MYEINNKTIICLLVLFFLQCQFGCKEATNRPNIKTVDIGDDPDFIRLSLLDSIPATEISFENRIIDFGNVTSDTILTANFYFKNTGNHPLVIAYVHPDCSCTNFSIREDTIEPKENSLISVEFNTFGRYGYQTIFATLACNSQERFHLLSLKCNITE